MNYLQKNKENYIKDLSGLIKIESYLKKDSVYPTKEMKDAILYMINLANKSGMKSFYDPEGYYGYIEIGQGKEMIGILGHVDVVPPGDLDGWNTNPFILKEIDNKLFGRGVADDKGPLMLNFYLMKELFENNIELNKRIRLIFPTDEESFWRGVKKYVEKEELPTIGYTPDSMFPVTYSERAVYQFKLKSEPNDLFEIKSGNAPNVVPNKAKFINKKTKEEINTIGKAHHALAPHKGESALLKLIDKINIDHKIINFIKNEINNQTNGEKLFGKIYADDDAEITVNIGLVNINSDISEIIIDMRIPNTVTLEKIESHIINKANKYELVYERYDYLVPIHISKDSKIVKSLTESYTEIMGKEIKPQASGGATYARSMPNIVAYGPLFDWSPKTEHQDNEHIFFNDYVNAYDIYKLVIKKWLS